MIVCDRCGKKITDTRDREEWNPFIYERAAAGMWHKVDLCKDCSRELEDYKKRAESYFMVNKDNPKDIFNGVKYWSD